MAALFGRIVIPALFTLLFSGCAPLKAVSLIRGGEALPGKDRDSVVAFDLKDHNILIRAKVDDDPHGRRAEDIPFAEIRDLLLDNTITKVEVLLMSKDGEKSVALEKEMLLAERTKAAAGR